MNLIPKKGIFCEMLLIHSLKAPCRFSLKFESWFPLRMSIILITYEGAGDSAGCCNRAVDVVFGE